MRKKASNLKLNNIRSQRRRFRVLFGWTIGRLREITKTSPACSSKNGPTFVGRTRVKKSIRTDTGTIPHRFRSVWIIYRIWIVLLPLSVSSARPGQNSYCLETPGARRGIWRVGFGFDDVPTRLPYTDVVPRVKCATTSFRLGLTWHIRYGSCDADDDGHYSCDTTVPHSPRSDPWVVVLRRFGVCYVTTWRVSCAR